MLTFSEQHNWQGNETIQQILVFPNQEVKELFEHEMESRLVQERTQRNDSPTDDDIKSTLSDSNAGAIYKLRAIKDVNDNWIPIIRCGITGGQIGNDGIIATTAEIALRHCLERLKHDLIADCIAQLKAMP
jgi:hypothetical protein